MSGTNRRNFILNTALGGVGAYYLDSIKIVDQILKGVVSNAHAQSLGGKKILSFFNDGGMPNWMFNLGLYPHGVTPDEQYKIPGLGTNIEASTGKATFNQSQRGDYYYPPVWFYPIPTYSNGTISTSWISPETLLDSSLIVRGIWNPSDGHELSQFVTYRPIGSNHSLHGIFTNQAQLKLPAILIDHTRRIYTNYSSPDGVKAIVESNATNTMNSISSSFTEKASLFRKNPQIDSLIKSALKELDNNSFYKKNSSKINRNNAEELIRSNMAGLVTEFQTKKLKYLMLFEHATKFNAADANTHLAGLLDQPLTNYSSNIWGLNFIDRKDLKFAENRDLRELFNNSIKADYISEAFAMAEVLFENNLSSSIVAMGGSFSLKSDILLKISNSLPHTNNQVTFHSDDGHDFGLAFQTLTWSMYSRGYIACLYEFISHLKSKQLFENILITYSTDFARNPQITGNASDHGWNANSIMVFNGEINSPLMVGNTYANAATLTKDNFRKNMWGLGKESEVLKNHIGLGNMNNTVLQLAGLPGNTNNSENLLTKNNGKWAEREKPKTV